VEGYRQDVRVINLSYLTTDWYAAQHRLPAYDAAPAPMLADKSVFGQGRRQTGYIMRNDTLRMNMLDFLDYYYGPEPDRNAQLHHVSYPIAMAGTVVIPGDSTRGWEDIVLNLPDVLTKKNRQPVMTQSDMLTFDIIASSAANGWNRPVYIANTVPDDYSLSLQPYMYATGMAHQIMPHRNEASYKANNDRAFENITERFRWGGLDSEGGEDVYLDETVSRMVASTRYAILEAVESLYAAGDYDRALQLMNLMVDKLPTKNAPYSIQAGSSIADLFLVLAEATGSDDARERAREIYEHEIERYADYIPYMQSLTREQFSTLSVGDRAVYQILDSRGHYSYLASLIANYAESFGVDRAQDFLTAASEKTGVDLIHFFNTVETHS
ncbi:MAG: hypothetical protein K2N10_01325, partial [Muribaculaceae bacterium]|nr:hypothetical protein [Muribaculaceae bacterium]